MIVNSILDNDFYQFTMSQAAWKHLPDLNVRYQFRNRTFSVPLADRIDLPALRAHVDAVRSLHVTADEADYLRSLGCFDPAWLDWLTTMTLPEVEIGDDNGHLTVEYEGDMASAIFWETILLALVSETYYRRFEALNVEGRLRLDTKIDYLRNHPLIKFAEFGTRRRYSRDWQAHVLDRLLDQVPDSVTGTSNVALAREHGIKPVGTMAHQMYMVAAAREMSAARAEGRTPDLHAAQNWVLDTWEAEYGQHPHLLVMLPDTYGTDFFLDGLTADRADRWAGMRQDSGDPFDIGEAYIRWYRQHDIEPTEKTTLFTDGLDIRKMSLLTDKFHGRVSEGYGFGTGLTNDLGFESLSIVIKPSWVDGEPAVKLSDNIAKATGPTTESVAAYKAAVGYHATVNENPKY